MENSTSSAAFKAYDTESLAGKRVLITGGTTGIGRSTAILLASQGATVMIFGRNEKELNDAIEAGKDRGLENKIIGFTADIGYKEGIETVFRKVDEQMNGLDILINNAGIPFEGIENGNYDDWQYLLNTNLLAYMACSHEAVKRMKEQSKGEILFIGSLSAKVKSAGSSVYTASKAGVAAFSETLRKEVSSLNIKVTLIEPGLVDTDMTSKMDDKKKELIESNKMLLPEDIAAYVLYTLRLPWRCNLMSGQVVPMQE